MPSLIITRAPIGVSLQDAGRRGYLRYGISEAGPMDWVRHAMVNQMLGKTAASTVIEIGPAGIGLTLDSGELQLAFAGPRFTVVSGGNTFSGPLRWVLKAGEQLEIIPKSGAMWCYLGFRGLPKIPHLLGSHAENRVGGLHAVRLDPGSVLNIEPGKSLLPHVAHYIDPLIIGPQREIGILPSSQYRGFSKQMRERLVAEPLAISPRFDRMAYRLVGVRLECASGHDILSDGVTMGAIQVPGDGRPFILMADHQPTGGYPKIAAVCKADLPRIAQIAPGQPFIFSWISMEQALARWRSLQQQINSLQALKGFR